MRIAIYGREFNNSVLPYVQEVFNVLDQYKTPILVYQKYLDFIKDIGMMSHLAQTRSNGLLSMVKQMKNYALAFQLKNEQI